MNPRDDVLDVLPRVEGESPLDMTPYQRVLQANAEAGREWNRMRDEADTPADSAPLSTQLYQSPPSPYRETTIEEFAEVIRRAVEGDTPVVVTSKET